MPEKYKKRIKTIEKIEQNDIIKTQLYREMSDLLKRQVTECQ